MDFRRATASRQWNSHSSFSATSVLLCAPLRCAQAYGVRKKALSFCTPHLQNSVRARCFDVTGLLSFVL